MTSTDLTDFLDDVGDGPNPNEHLANTDSLWVKIGEDEEAVHTQENEVRDLKYKMNMKHWSHMLEYD
jgi:hypothetical protein